MNLDKFLEDKKISNAEFGRQIGITGEAIGNYRNLRRIPRHEIMAKISEATNGEVTANDFYSVGA